MFAAHVRFHPAHCVCARVSLRALSLVFIPHSTRCAPLLPVPCSCSPRIAPFYLFVGVLLVVSLSLSPQPRNVGLLLPCQGSAYLVTRAIACCCICSLIPFSKSMQKTPSPITLYVSPYIFLSRPFYSVLTSVIDKMNLFHHYISLFHLK